LGHEHPRFLWKQNNFIALSQGRDGKDIVKSLLYQSNFLSIDQFNVMPMNAGFITRSELVECYATKSGRSVHYINFHHALGVFRLTIIIAQMYIRYHRGQTRDKQFAPSGKMIPLISRAAPEISQTQ